MEEPERTVRAEKPSSPCVFGQTAVKVYPHQPLLPVTGKPATKKPWSLIICTGCFANEILPIACERETKVNPRFPKQLWGRLHGFTRRFRVTDSTGQKSIREEFIAPTFAVHHSLDLVESKQTVETGVGVALDDAFTVFDYERETKDRIEQEALELAPPTSG